MVQQMINSKFNEYGLANTGTGLPNCDKPQQMAVKKTALRDLQNDNRIVVHKLPGNPSFLKDRGPITDAIKISGIKRPTPECHPSPPSHQSPSSSGGANGHLVYIRRKSEPELVKINNCDNTHNNTDCPHLRQFSHQEQVITRQRTQMQGPKISCFPAFAPIPMASLMTFSSGGPSVPPLGKPLNDLSPAEPYYPTVTSGVPHPVNSQGMSDQHWKERFLQLQTHLKNCDHSSQEDYIQMLRSLSSAGRSRHAVELEKRAIHLLLEEGKELHRMKVLNVFGKSATKNTVSPSTQQVKSEK